MLVETFKLTKYTQAHHMGVGDGGKRIYCIIFLPRQRDLQGPPLAEPKRSQILVILQTIYLASLGDGNPAENV
jgi:hypothetical protein